MASLRVALARRMPTRTLLVPRRYSSTTPTTENPIPVSDPAAKGKERGVSPVSATNERRTTPVGAHDGYLQESVVEGEEYRVAQSPNRKSVWSPNQQAREKAMTGPRFEQTIMADQPRPLAAIELIHKQPVRWTKDRIVSCDGGGGPLGHPRIFINVDKPQVCWCTYCGLPFAHEKHKAHLESLPSTPYPLTPHADPAEVPENQRITAEPLGQR